MPYGMVKLLPPSAPPLPHVYVGSKCFAFDPFAVVVYSSKGNSSCMK